MPRTHTNRFDKPRVHSFCTDTDTDTDTLYGMRYGIRQKLCVCTHLARNGIRNCVRFCCIYSSSIHIYTGVYIQRAAHFPFLFPPPSVMAPVHSKPLLDVCLREEVRLFVFLLCKQHKIRQSRRIRVRTHGTTIYFYFLDFYRTRIRICIRTNGIAEEKRKKCVYV